MVEGHQCHRVAAAHRKLLVGHAFKATSPNGRFCEGAAAISNRPLSKIEVHGKNLFYFFSKASTASTKKLQTLPLLHEIVHVHFGMAGAFKTMSPPGEDPTATTRLRLENPQLNIIAHLSAMTVVHGDDEYYKAKVQTLGPDPLREDADAEQLWSRIQKSSKPIGLVLMDQSLVAGLGNIYRAEVLFKARVHPEQPARSVTRSEFDEIWKHSVLLLQRGFQTGSILTVNAADATALGAPWTRRYVYNHSHCGMCKGPIKTWNMANRTVYACETCQVLRGKGNLPKARKDAMAVAANAKEFVSHCAAEGSDSVTPKKMTIAQLRSALLGGVPYMQKLGEQPPAPARKAELLAALKAASDGTKPTVEKPAAQVQAATPPPMHAAQSLAALGGSQESTDLQVVLEQLGGSKGTTGSNKSTEVAAAADVQNAEEATAVPRTPKRMRPHRNEPECEETPDSKHAKQRLGLRTVNSCSEHIHVVGEGSTDAHEDRQPQAHAASQQQDPTGVGKQQTGDSLTVEMVKGMKVSELKAALKKHALPFSSRAAKPELIQLLIDVVSITGNDGEAQPMLDAGKNTADDEEGPAQDESTVVVPGTKGLCMVATAGEAANEKVQAGENRAVEHVALGDSDVAGNLL